jgi:SOS response regulatory protein OraA/RecX
VPYANTGKIIESITTKRKQIIIAFLSGENLALSPDQFTQGYYYVGKVISPKEFEQIYLASQTQPFIDYGFRLLSKGRYTEYQIREKLYHRKAIKPQVEEVINRLKQAHLIDDQTLMKDWVHHFQQRGYGERVIKEKLFEKKFSNELIQKLTLDASIEDEKIDQLTLQFNQKYSRSSYRLKIETIKKRLLERGYELKRITQSLLKLPQEDATLELVNLGEDLKKGKRLYKRRFSGVQLQEKLINFLLRKGYNYSIIKRLLKESYHAD